MTPRRSAIDAAWQGLSLEFRPLLHLAGPVVIAELGWMAMGLVDMALVGRVGPEAIGAVGIGGSIFFAIAVVGMGVLLGLDYTVAHAFGAGRIGDAHRALVHGVYVSCALTVLLTAVIRSGRPYLYSLGIREEVLIHVGPYLDAVTWSLLPLFLYSTLRRYLQALGFVKPVMFALLSANLVNAVTGWVLIFGHFGAPIMGATGAGWATCLSRVYMVLVLVTYILRHERRHHTGLLRTPLRIETTRLRQLIVLGLPAAVQLGLEVGVFATTTALAGKLAPSSLAAHQIALNIASFTFMVPLGISSATAVRVGQALGRGMPAHAARSGWTSLVLGGLFMIGAGIVLLSIPRSIVRVFTTDPTVIATGASLLFVAALFQLFDGVQVVATGALRGTADTRTPMIVNLVGHWLIGLPLGYALCFRQGWGVIGLWTGLCVGLVAVALVLVRVWAWRVETLQGAARG